VTVEGFFGTYCSLQRVTPSVIKVAGLMLGAMGVGNLFSSCVDFFDIVVRDRGFPSSTASTILAPLIITSSPSRRGRQCATTGAGLFLGN